MLNEIDKSRLIFRWWTCYIDDCDEIDRIMNKGDKWLEFLLKKIKDGKKPTPPHIYVIEENVLTKAYLSYESCIGKYGSNIGDYDYVTATKKYCYKRKRINFRPDRDGIDLWKTTLYSNEDLSSLLEQNSLYKARVYDVWYYRQFDDREMIEWHSEPLRYHKKRADEINNEVRKKYNNE
jgi:hypothetical protein